jgi:putative transposase
MPGFASKMIRSFKYRLFPTPAQQRLLVSWLGLTRELYNAALQERRDAWTKQKVSVSCFDQMRVLPEIRAERFEFSGIPIVVLRGVLRRLDKAFKAFFSRCKRGEKPGYPRFKGRAYFDSILIDDVKKHPVVAGDKRLEVPLLGKIKIKLHRLIEGRVKAVRIKLEGDGHWYVVLACVGVPAKPLAETDNQVGIDLGLLHFAATSDGDLFENPRPLRAARLRLERAYRRVSRRKRGSRRRRKAVAMLRRAHHRIAQVRRQHAIDVANAIVKQNDIIVVEKLNVKGLASGMLAKSVHDAGWSIFLHWLNVKAESAGREIVEVDPRGTSQICSGCGVEVRKDLTVRVHDCPRCDLHLDRDVNAARNIKALGLSARRAAAAVGARR